MAAPAKPRTNRPDVVAKAGRKAAPEVAPKVARATVAKAAPAPGMSPVGKPQPAQAARAKKPPVGSSDRPSPRMSPAEIEGFLGALDRANPDAASELAFRDPFTLLVAVVLSAQTTDAAVNRATPALFAAAPDPAAMVRLGADGIGPFIRTIGLWQGKARNVFGLAQQLLERHGGAVPASREALEALPGVGRKTANVVLNVAFGESTMAVDTHVFRLGNRTGIAPGKTPRAVEDGLVRRIPAPLLRNAHHWLILHGRYVCKARRPECWRCAAAAWCRFPAKLAGPAGNAAAG